MSERFRRLLGGSRLKQSVVQILALNAALAAVCLLCRVTVMNTYTASIPLPLNAPQAESLRFLSTDPRVIQPGDAGAGAGFVRVPIHPQGPGAAYVDVVDQQGNYLATGAFRVGRLGTVYNLSDGGFTGDGAVLCALCVFFLAISAVMLWHFIHSTGVEQYSYATVYFAGLFLFALISGLELTTVTIRHLLWPRDYSMLSAYGALNSASKRFMLLTMPLVVLFALALMISNGALLRHEGARLQNLLGLAVSGLLIAGEAIGLWLFSRDFMGSEWQGRVESTLENVYATLFVYFECMLAGASVCALRAARHQPDWGQDFIIVLGCQFRRDGTLPPLLRGRVDRALAFWREQKKATGREAVFIPSGGQGRNESMAEAEAMRRYLVGEGIPPRLIQMEDQSRNTFENMAFSKAIIEKRRPGGSAVFSTTNYHVFRSGVWAVRAGLRAEGIGSKTVWWYWPNAFMRECAGLLKARWKEELILLVAFLAYFGVLSMVLG